MFLRCFTRHLLSEPVLEDIERRVPTAENSTFSAVQTTIYLKDSQWASAAISQGLRAHSPMQSITKSDQVWNDSWCLSSGFFSAFTNGCWYPHVTFWYMYVAGLYMYVVLYFAYLYWRTKHVKLNKNLKLWRPDVGIWCTLRPWCKDPMPLM